MATLKLYLRETGADIDPSVDLDKQMQISPGGTHVYAQTKPLSVGFSTPQVTKTPGGTKLRWYSLPLDPITISGTVTFNVWGYEPFVGTALWSAVLTRVDNAGANIETVASGVSSNMGSSTTVRQFTGAVAAPVTLASGDRLLLILSAHITTGGVFDILTSCGMAYDGPTADDVGDTWVSMTTDVAPAEQPPEPGDAGNTTEEGTVTECP